MTKFEWIVVIIGVVLIIAFLWWGIPIIKEAIYQLHQLSGR